MLPYYKSVPCFVRLSLFYINSQSLICLQRLKDLGTVVSLFFLTMFAGERQKEEAALMVETSEEAAV